MKRYLVAVITCTVFTAISACDVVSLTFPSDFQIGAATAAYQVEGAWNVSGKGENIMDRWTHEHPETLADGSNGDVACNSYYKYKEDVQWIKALGLDFYRFSISWSRILPTGFTNVINEDGLQYYKNLTAELVANGIKPAVTLYHWDHPQVIEDMGGWTNELIVDWFVAYARVVFEALGDNVKTWITINEPTTFCSTGYETRQLAPAKVIPRFGTYLCGNNVLKAHAKTYRMYNAEFRESQNGQIGLVHALQAHMPLTPDDEEAAERSFQFVTGWLAHPMHFGDYPEIMKTRVANISAAQGYPRSRLPVLSEEWISIINGSWDYFGMNHYTTHLCTFGVSEEEATFFTDSGVIHSVDPAWPTAASAWLQVNPPGFGYLLRKIRDDFGNPPIWIMENGYSDYGGAEDYDRISFFYEYLRELLIAVKRDKCNVKGYTIWSLLDNFEWTSGYTEKFGIVAVDFDDDNRTRSVKMSTSWWASVLAARKLQPVPTRPTSQTKVQLPWK